MTGSAARRLAGRGPVQGAVRVLRGRSAIRSGPPARSCAACSRRRRPATARRAFSTCCAASFPLRLSAPTRRWSAGADQSTRRPLDRRRSTCGIAPGRRCSVIRLPAWSSARPSPRARASCATARSRPKCGRNIRRRSPSPSSSRRPRPAWRREATLTIDPGARWTDRRWHTVTIRSAGDRPSRRSRSTVTLSTRVAAGADESHAWALFGEPRFEWRRPLPRCGARSRRSPGGSAPTASGKSLELLRVTGITSHDAYPRWVARHTRKEADLAALAGQVAALPHQPLISIVTPVYNTEPRWLRACIESVRRQVYPNWQLCLCDDASTTPQTIEALREYAGRPADTDPLLRRQRRHLGGLERRAPARDGRVRRAAGS